jgi:hypothetical protein
MRPERGGVTVARPGICQGPWAPAPLAQARRATENEGSRGASQTVTRGGPPTGTPSRRVPVRTLALALWECKGGGGRVAPQRRNREGTHDPAGEPAGPEGPVTVRGTQATPLGRPPGRPPPPTGAVRSRTVTLRHRARRSGDTFALRQQRRVTGPPRAVVLAGAVRYFVPRRPGAPAPRTGVHHRSAGTHRSSDRLTVAHRARARRSEGSEWRDRPGPMGTSAPGSTTRSGATR